MNVPMILNKNERRYILEKIYNNYALYSDLQSGLKECFNFHDLGLIEQSEWEKLPPGGGAVKI